MSLPFDGAISTYYQDEAPGWVRKQIDEAKKDSVLDPEFPYDHRWDKDEYEDAFHAVQIELVKLQSWIKKSGERIVVVFEGRDAAGKGGTIKRFRENLNARGVHVAALPKPTDRERGQWYFQRYIKHMPSEGEITLFDRSWYNRGVVEHVFDFCTPEERELFFRQVTPFETMLVGEGIRLFKIWLTVGRAEQLRRMLHREGNPLKQWKLSSIDVKGLALYDTYTKAIGETLGRSHTDETPWTIVRADDKRRARIQALRSVLTAIPYDGRKDEALQPLDDQILGGPTLWHKALHA
ncbi:polyphosphate kinase 2 [Aestuariibius sp. 2305UL40-4]|uniref:polyphosphate kinase 2 n=1 Tax=Aestuariibius violaceus TaxID=3234132 RepID=UPI00345E5D0A